MYRGLVDFARTTAGQYSAGLGRLCAVETPVPPLPEQRRTGAELDASDRLQTETAAGSDAFLDRGFEGEI
ncbi:MAG: hypothetical protein ACLQVX_06380 [Limisphaerales bacterium]